MSQISKPINQGQFANFKFQGSNAIFKRLGLVYNFGMLRDKLQFKKLLMTGARS